MALQLHATRKDNKITFFVIDTARNTAIPNNMSEHEAYVYLLRRRIAEAITNHEAGFRDEVTAALSDLSIKEEKEGTPF